MTPTHCLICVGLTWEPDLSTQPPPWKVVEVADLEEALQTMESLKPSVMLCHYLALKDYPGLYLQRIRRLAPSTRLYVVDAELEVHTMLTLINDCQVDRFLNQPLDWPTLRQELSRFMTEVVVPPLDFVSYAQNFAEPNRRILCVDDDEDVLNFYQDCLSPRTNPTLEALAMRRLRRRGQNTGQESPLRTSRFFPCEVVTTTSGERAIRLIKEARAQGRPFAAGFFDMKMPGGIDGLETLRQVRLVDPQLACCVVTAYTDHSLYDLAQVLPDHAQWMYFHKPFGERELLQSSAHLLELWHQRQRQEQVQGFATHLQRMAEQLSRLKDAAALAQQLETLFTQFLQAMLGTTIQGLALVGKTVRPLHFEGLQRSLSPTFCEKLACQAIQERRSLLLDGRSPDPGVAEELQRHGLSQLLLQPLTVGARTYGLLLAGHETSSRRFEREDLELLSLVVEQTQVLLEAWWQQHSKIPFKPVSNSLTSISSALAPTFCLSAHYFS